MNHPNRKFDVDHATPSTRHTKPDWPLALAELIRRRDEHLKLERRVSIIWNLCFFTILISNVFFAGHIDRLKPSRPWIPVAYLIGFFAFLILNLVFVIRSLRNRTRSFGLQCPSCGILLDRRALPIVVATGNCGACGAKLLQDQPPPR
ncbi:MAG: hypothetical protein V4726_09950 [Verrucomicrobiota bacterium]